MLRFLHYVSATGSFMFLYGVLYLMLRYTVGLMPVVKNTKIYGVPLELPLFSVVVIWFIFRYIEISSPWLNK